MGRIGSINNGQSSWAKMGVMRAFGTSSWGGFSDQASLFVSTKSSACEYSAAVPLMRTRPPDTAP